MGQDFSKGATVTQEEELDALIERSTTQIGLLYKEKQKLMKQYNTVKHGPSIPAADFELLKKELGEVQEKLNKKINFFIDKDKSGKPFDSLEISKRMLTEEL